MFTPLDTLFMFNDAIQDLDMAQSWIDSARVAHADNQEVQLQLDRRQTLVNDRRAKIELAKLHIASSN